MESLIKKIMFGISGNGYEYTRMTIPLKWCKEMGLTNEDREILVTFDGNQIIIKKLNLKEEEK